MRKMAIKHTPEQRQAITITDRNLIVSAGAGAGKTSTLVERIYNLLADQRADINRMLIVTFTRLAAEEMKSRLTTRLEKALADPALATGLRIHLEEQRYQLPRAQISTIHSFCLEMISAFPEKAGLAPGFELMLEQEIRLFQRQYVSRRIEKAFEDEGDEAKALTIILDQLHPISGIERLPDMVLSMFRFLDSVPDHDQFLALAEKNFRRASSSNPLHDSHQSVEIQKYIDWKLGEVREHLEKLLSIPQDDLHSNYRPQIHHCEDLISWLIRYEREPLGQDSFEEFVDRIGFPKLGIVKEEDRSETDTLFRDLREEVKEKLKALKSQLSLFTEENLAQDFYSSAELSTTLLRDIAIPWYSDLFTEHLKNRRLTFSHLERLTYRLLYEPDGSYSMISVFYRQHFQHVLVDEFQDVNELQFAIVQAISRPAAHPDGGNLFVVGDVKQSIYQFRQAEPALFLDVYRTSREHDNSAEGRPDTRINLRSNFRSAPALLDEFNGVFGKLFREKTCGVDYFQGHAFDAGRTVDGIRKPGFTIDLIDDAEAADDGLSRDEREAKHTAARIQALGPPWRDICILLRSTVGASAAMAEALNELNIPVYTDARLGFLTAVEVLEFQAILQAVYNPYHEHALLGMLRGPAARWSADQLLALRAIDRRAFLYDNLRSMRDSDQAAAQVLDHLERWRTESARRPMAELFSIIYDDLDLLESSSVRPGGDQRRLNLEHLQEQARIFDQFMRKGLGEFLSFLEDLLDNDEDFAPPSLLREDADVVRIMSFHQSKGMEFPVVFLPFLGRKFNDRDLSQPFLFHREHGFATKFRDIAPPPDAPNPPLYEIFRTLRRNKNRAEELRLLYVAMTRAKEAVYLSASINHPREKLISAAGEPSRMSDTQILSANQFSDWIVAFAARRFPHIPDDDRPLCDGIASLRLPAPQSIGLEVSDAESEIDAPQSSQFIANFSERAAYVTQLAGKESADQIRAKVSVTELKRLYDSTRDPETPSPPLGARRKLAPEDWMPDSLLEEKPKGISRGLATHRFLALCDMEGIAFRGVKLSEERDRLAEEKFLTEEEAQAVALHDIAWFLNQPLGRRVRSNAMLLHRERPFTCAITPDNFPKENFRGPMILQGVADLLFQAPDGWVLIDYKTDYCGPDALKLDALIESYRPQTNLYRFMAERALEAPVAQCFLVFLQGQRVVEMDGPIDLAREIRAMIEAGAVLTEPPSAAAQRELPMRPPARV